MKLPTLILTLFTAAVSPTATHAQQTSEPTKVAAVNPDDQPADTRPPITIDRDAGTIDLAATMVNIEPQWLELVATIEGGREHEAIVTLDVQPSMLHLALVTLGLEPGHPLRVEQVEGETVTLPATGPRLYLYFLYDVDGETHQAPVESWVHDKATGETLAPGRWLFAGSSFRHWQGREYYMADEAGNAVSLVNFGDDLIVYQTERTQNTDSQELQINPQLPLPYGSPLTLRISIHPPEDAPQAPENTDSQPDKPASEQTPS